jgi:hypothetical protein
VYGFCIFRGVKEETDIQSTNKVKFIWSHHAKELPRDCRKYGRDRKTRKNKQGAGTTLREGEVPRSLKEDVLDREL